MKKKKKNWACLYSHTDTFVACPPLATCLALGVPRDTRPGPQARRRSGRAWKATLVDLAGLLFYFTL